MIDIEIIKALQLLRNPVFDYFFFIVTQFGDEVFIIILVGILYWTYSQKYAFKIIMGLTISTLLTLGLKEVFRRPRPFMVEGITAPPIEGVITEGYAFPSGHSQVAGGQAFVYFDLYQKHKKPYLKWLTIAALILIPFSRMYLAQHYLTDVIVGLLIGIYIMHHTFKFFDRFEDVMHQYVLYIIPVLLIVLIVFRDPNLYKGFGGWIGFVLGHFINMTYITEEKKESFLFKSIKVILGLATVFLLKEGLKIVFPTALTFEFLRYFIIGGWASLGVPLIAYYAKKHHHQTL
ncbi:MAG: phosphatase PAP2 family protein [Acholeplasmataceae bacterium]